MTAQLPEIHLGGARAWAGGGGGGGGGMCGGAQRAGFKKWSATPEMALSTVVRNQFRHGTAGERASGRAASGGGGGGGAHLDKVVDGLEHDELVVLLVDAREEVQRGVPLIDNLLVLVLEEVALLLLPRQHRRAHLADGARLVLRVVRAVPLCETHLALARDQQDEVDHRAPKDTRCGEERGAAVSGASGGRNFAGAAGVRSGCTSGTKCGGAQGFGRGGASARRASP